MEGSELCITASNTLRHLVGLLAPEAPRRRREVQSRRRTKDCMLGRLTCLLVAGTCVRFRDIRKKSNWRVFVPCCSRVHSPALPLPGLRVVIALVLDREDLPALASPFGLDLLCRLLRILLRHPPRRARGLVLCGYRGLRSVNERCRRLRNRRNARAE